MIYWIIKDCAGRYQIMNWWAQKDLNLRPADYESDALTN